MALKQRVSPQLFAIDGVGALGVSRGGLTVYLDDESDTIRHEVDEVIAREAPDAPVHVVLSAALTVRC